MQPIHDVSFGTSPSIWVHFYFVKNDVIYRSNKSGGWSREGIEQVSSTYHTTDNGVHITLVSNSSHITPFVVLVDVHGVEVRYFIAISLVLYTTVIWRGVYSTRSSDLHRTKYFQYLLYNDNHCIGNIKVSVSCKKSMHLLTTGKSWWKMVCSWYISIWVLLYYWVILCSYLVLMIKLLILPIAR